MRPCAWKLIDRLSKRQVRPQNGRAVALVDSAQADVDLMAITYEIAAMVSHVSVEVASDEITRAQKQSSGASSIRPATTDQSNSASGSVDIDAAFASLERLARNFKLNRSNPELKLAGFVEAALRHGVPMFNAGSAVACALVYMHATHLLRDVLMPHAHPLAPERIKNALAKLPEMSAITVDSASHIAWQLRHILDAVAAG